MIKVGILSMQRILNYGSFLQAFGLKMMLEDLNCVVEFVDYKPGECLIPDSGKGLFRKIFKTVDVLRYSAPFKEKLRFIRYKKNFATNYHHYLGIGEKMNYMPKLDMLIIGSDEVFNCVQNNINVGFSPELFGEGNRAKRLITYAASFGNTTLKTLEEYNVKIKVANWLMKFEAISVRDANTGLIVEKLTNKVPIYNLDPVLVYDFLSKCKEIPDNVKEKDYIILYGYSGRFSNEECRTIREYANKKNLSIFCIGGIQECCDKFIDCSPFHVIAYFKHADCIITDTFHGTIISIITHQKFVSLIRSTKFGNSKKMTDLLDRLHLKDRIMNGIENLTQLISKPINYKVTDKIIQKERKLAYTYLKENLSED